MSTALDHARGYLARGWCPVPVPYRRKAPVLLDWPSLRITEATLGSYFNGEPQNVGGILGPASGDVVDVDLDCPEAIALAPRFLPATACRFGRAGARLSHWFYVSASTRMEPFRDVDRSKMLELRAEGGQTILPGSTHESGEPIEFADDGPPAQVEAGDLRRAVAHLAAATLLLRHWPAKGSRHELVLAAAGWLLRGGADVADVAVVLTAVAVAADPTADTKIIRHDVASTAARLEAGEPVTGGHHLVGLLAGDGRKVLDRLREWLELSQERPVASEDGLHLTDVGNAQRFARDHGEAVRYCYVRRSWLVWDTTRWRWDDGDRVGGLAKTTARRLYEEAAQAKTEDKRKAVAKHAGYSESEPGVRRMLILAQSEPGIPVKIDQLDADPWLLNTPTGTIELRTGAVREHRREDLITKVTAAPYDPDARLPMFDSFLERMLPDEEVREFVRRVAGYGLTASTLEEKLFLVHGPTAGGKSTFLTALRRALGDYAVAADASTFMDRRQEAGAPRDDVVKLIGRRLVVSSEVKDGVRFATSLIKMMFGGDPMSGRALYERTIEFTPVFKLLIAANDRPKAPDDDDALWRRLHEIPFTISLPEAERDPAVKATLTDPDKAGAAILAWAVAGATAWASEGLGMPEAVRKATRAYRQAMDPITDFLAASCVLAPDADVDAGELRTAYEVWAKENGVRQPLGGRALADRLRARGCEQFRRHGGVRAWRGIRLRTDSDPDDPRPGDAGDAGDAETENPPYTRAHKESPESDVTTVTSVTAQCAGCDEVTLRARLTELEGALWCPSCLWAKGSHKPGRRP